MHWQAVLLLAAGCSFSTSARNDTSESDAPVAIDAAIDAPDAPGPTPKFLLRIDVGNTAADFVDSTGVTWKRDVYCDGDPPIDPGEVRGTMDGALYRTAVFRINANVTCAIDGVPNAMLRVTFYGAELWVGGQDCNFGMQRTMDITLETTRVVNDLNVWTASGGCARAGGANQGMPFTREYDIMVTDGTLNILVSPGNAGSRDPVVQALEVREL